MRLRPFSYLRIFLLVFLLAGCSSPSTPLPATEEAMPNLEKYFQGFDGALVLYRLKDDRYIRHQPERCAERLLPASTYKIMNALIGLETSVVTDENHVIHWDGTQYPNPVWNQDHTLKTAFQNSVVWYYQEVARQIGKEKMQYYLDAVGYGNQDMHGNLDSFWLDGAVRISADEQVELLKKLYHDELPFSRRSMAIVRDMMLVETDETHQLRGKTGTGLMGDIYVGWFVGYEERDGNVTFFALNIKGSNPETTGSKAKEIFLEVLKDSPDLFGDCPCVGEK